LLPSDFNYSCRSIGSSTRKWVARVALMGLPSLGIDRVTGWVTFFFLRFFCYVPYELMGRIVVCDHCVGQNDIFKFIYCFMILFLIYYSVSRNDILKFLSLIIVYLNWNQYTNSHKYKWWYLKYSSVRGPLSKMAHKAKYGPSKSYYRGCICVSCNRVKNLPYL
jgi:hypothetical protein